MEITSSAAVAFFGKKGGEGGRLRAEARAA